MIMDLTNARRAYLMSQVAGDDYRFFLHSPRKVISTENEREIRFIQEYCPQILDKKIPWKACRKCQPDVLIVTSVSMYFKEFDKNLVNLVNSFKKQWVAIDYAWEAGRKPRVQKNRQFRRKFSNVALAAFPREDNNLYLPYSQPELDMYAHPSKFVTPEQILKKYKLPSDKKIVVVTSHGRYEELKPFMAFLSRYRNDIHVVWKLKFKQREYEKKVRKAMSSNQISYTSIAGPKEKSHTDFLTPLCELSLVALCHINLLPLSYSHAEMIRAGIPTFCFGKKGMEVPKYVLPVMDHFWAPESIKSCSKFSLNIARPKVIVDDLHCTKNLVGHLRG